MTTDPSDAGEHDAASVVFPDDDAGEEIDADVPNLGNEDGGVPDQSGCTDGVSCDDGDPCTSDDRCAYGVCRGTPMSCDAPPNACYASSGVCSDGSCNYAPLDGASCDDGNACTSGDSCASGACAGVPLACNTPPNGCYAPTGTCTDGACSYALRDGASCDDGNACTVGDTCASGTCTGTPMQCPALDVCHPFGFCHAGACAYYFSDGTSCDDSDAATSADVCWRGECAGTPSSGWVEIAAGGDHTCARSATGSVVCWGDNQYGQLGDGTGTDKSTPTPVSGLTDAVQISARGNHTCARRATGAVVCWGAGAYGQIGDGTRLGSRVPTAVSGLTDAVDISAGSNHTCARRGQNRQVVCWGENRYGQLGDGTYTDRLVPTPVLIGRPSPYEVDPSFYYLTYMREIAAGDMHTCARGSVDGRVICWGQNHNGQLGDGTTYSSGVASTSASGLLDAVQLSAGGDHTCAERDGGSVACWGFNGVTGRLGDGTMTDRYTPTPVVGVSDVVRLSVGSAHTCARLSTGRVDCWGANTFGELGDGTKTLRLTAAPVAGLTDAVEVAAGRIHSCAIRSTGAIVCWGNNGQGQLGDGTTTERLTPTPVRVP